MISLHEAAQDARIFPRMITMKSVVLFLGILLQWTGGVSSQSMDQLILQAGTFAGGDIAKHKAHVSVGIQNDHVVTTDDSVVVELDIRYTREQWELRQAEIVDIHEGRHKRKATRYESRRWTNNIVPYYLSNVFSSANLGQIQEAMDEWEKYTCLNFKPASGSDSNYIFLQNGGGCSSYVGMIGGSQEVSLAPGCRVKSIIIHELGHAIGFQHEQTRPDRDQYVTIYYQNIVSGVEYNFQKYTTESVNDYSIPYDYRSVMHYGPTAFTTNGQKTIATKDPAYQNIIGSAKGLSFRDIKLANTMYDCNGGCSQTSCPNEGFVGKDCKCWCPGSGDIAVVHCTGGGGGGGTGPCKSDTGPFSSECLEYLWKDVGCSLSGSTSPRNADSAQIDWWNSSPLAVVQQDMALYHQYAIDQYLDYQEKCFGSAEDCNAQNGPYSTECLTALWIEAGCEEKGTFSPKNANSDQIDWWNSRPVTEVKEDMILYHEYALAQYLNYAEKCFGGCDDAQNGPYTKGCLDSLWVQAGCQPSGTSSPQNADSDQIEWWNSRPIDEVKSDMSLYYQYATANYSNYGQRCFGNGQKRSISHGVFRNKRSCRDHHMNCKAWAIMGECDKEPAQMHATCARACDVC